MSLQVEPAVYEASVRRLVLPKTDISVQVSMSLSSAYMRRIMSRCASQESYPSSFRLYWATPSANQLGTTYPERGYETIPFGYPYRTSGRRSDSYWSHWR